MSEIQSIYVVIMLDFNAKLSCKLRRLKKQEISNMNMPILATGVKYNWHT